MRSERRQKTFLPSAKDDHGRFDPPCRPGRGCFLEDQVWRKRSGQMRGKRVIERGEYVQKIRAAVEARGDRDFFLVARTERERSAEAEVRRILYLLYEVQKYIVIRRVRKHDPGRADAHRQQSLRLARPLER